MESEKVLNLMLQHTLELKSLLEKQKNKVRFQNDGFLKTIQVYDDYSQVIDFFKAQLQLVFKYALKDKDELYQFFDKLKNEEATLLHHVFTQKQWDEMKIHYEKMLLEKNIENKEMTHKIKI